MNRTRNQLVVVIGLVAGLLGESSPARAAPSAGNEEAARLLSSTDGRTGTLEGLPAEYRFQMSGRYGDQTTTILTIARATPSLLLQVRRRDASDDELEKRHHLVDVKLGDAPFDDAYVVEGAPSDLVRALLDEPLRRALTDERSVVLNIDANQVQLLVNGSIATVDEARRFVGLGAMVVKHLQSGLVPAAGTALGADERAKELAHLETIRGARHTNGMVAVIPAGVVGCLLLAALIWNLRRQRRRG